MRKFYLPSFIVRSLPVFVLFLLLHGLAGAQTNISIGTGTTGNTNIGYPCPIQDYYEGSRMQFLYRASELTAAGMTAGTISSITYNVTALNATTVVDNYAIKIGSSSVASLGTTTWETVSGTVYGPVDYTPVTGLNTFTFTTPFFWDGVSNIIIEVCNGSADAPNVTTYSNNVTVPWTTGLAFNGSHTYRIDGQVGPLCGTAETANTGTQTTRPNITFGWTALPPCTSPPVPGTAVVSPSTFYCEGTTVALQLTGNTYGASLTYQWQSAAAIAGTYTNVGAALTVSPAYSVTATATPVFYRCAVTCAGSTSYSVPVRVAGSPTLPGNTYTINSGLPTGGNNFHSFTEAVTALSCGITGPVIFNVTTTGATYNEQVIIPQIAGTSVTNTVTFNGNGNILAFTSTNSNERAVLKLNGADFVIIDSLVINAGGSSTTEYGYGVQLINNADSNIIRRCKINTDVTLTSANYAGVVINASASAANTTGATLCDGNLFSGNTITGGYYGMTMVGGLGSLIAANKFVNNIIKDFYSYGILAGYTDNALVEGNIITRPARAVPGTFYGIYFGSSGINTKVSKNILSNPMGGDNSSTNTMYGIYFENMDGTAAAPNIISNNLLYDFNGAGAIYALYNTNSPYSRYYHNTISLDNSSNGSTSLTRGFYQSTSATGVEFRNNIVSIARGGGGSNQAIYLPTGNAVLSNNNNLYVTPGGSNYVGYLGGNQSSLSDWQTASGQDAFSVSLDPQFTAPATGNFLPANAAAWNNLGIPVGIATDINGAARNQAAPDLGAYENAIQVCVTPPVAGKIVSGVSQTCIGTPFTLSLKNGTTGSGQTYQWQSSTDNISFTNISGANASLLTTTQSQDSLFYRCVVTCGSSSFSDTLKQKATICYCTSVPTSTVDTEIFSVTVNGATNTSDCNTAAPGPGSLLGQYSNFYPRGALTTVIQGTTVPFTVVHEDCTPNIYYPAACAIWIDFNKDGDFDDAGEKVFVENALTIGPRIISGNITVPLTATPGLTGMRVILAEGTANTGAGLVPCLSYTFGETEDYLITIGQAVPCSGVPVAGTAMSSKTFVCPGENFDLRSSGTTVALGLSYQWQSSADSATWTNIPSATAAQLSTTQTATRYYRYIVTCANGGATSIATPVLVTSPGIVSGTFTINSAQPTGSGNFKSYNDAYAYIKCGINGAVVFNVAPGSGSYNEQLIMTPVPGASATNTITFNGNGTVLSYKSTNTNERAVIKLDGADYVIFDSLVINASGTAGSEYGFGVQLINNADSNIIRKCVINITTNSTSANYAGVVINASATGATTSGATTLCDGNLFEANTITGGYYGMTMVGGSANPVTNQFIRNTIKDFYDYGIYLAYTSDALIEANTITRPNRTAVDVFYGIYLTSGNTGTKITRNRLFNTMGGNKASTSSQYGIYLSGSDATTTAPVLVTNNLLYDFNGAGLIYALYNAGSDYAQYYHNTVSLDNGNNTSTTATRGFYQTTAATGITFKNNIVTILRTGGGTNHAIYLATATSTVAADYNNYFLSDSLTNFTGNANATDYRILNDWKTTTSQDLHSVVFNPEYLDASGGDYRPMSNLLDNLGTPVNVAVDINLAARSITTPDMGAYEFASVACTNPPVPGTVISTVNPACLGVPFTLSITGGITGYGQTYQWQSSADNTTWANLTGAVNRSLTTTQQATTYYRLVYTCGVGVPSAPILITTPSLINGAYTINKAQATGGRNFQSFNDAYIAMKCGINGAVVFDVAPGSGVYNEQLIMEYIPGASATNTITFKGNGNTIRFASINTDQRAVIKLKGAKYVTFDSLVIDASTGNYGYGVQLTANTDSNTVKNCVINSSQTSTTEEFAGIVISGSDTDPIATGLVLSDNNNFENNKINGGYYGITLAATFTNGANGLNRFKGNNIKDFYRTGIYVAGSYGTVIDSNTFSRPTRENVGEFAGVLFTTQKNTGCTVSRNRISNPFGAALSTNTSGFYGINFLNSDGSTGSQSYNENTVVNNLVYNINGNGAAYGIANTGSDYANYFHNTIVLDNVTTASTALSRGFYQTTTAGGLIFMNNIVSITTGGAGAKHCVYLGAGLPLAMDYNNYYINSAAGTNSVGYYTTDRASLANWITALGNGLEQKSVSTIPAFINPLAGNYTPGNAGLNNRGFFVGITNDILNQVRDANTPDIGAFEFTPSPCSVPPVNGHALIAPASICQNKPVYLSMNISAYGSGQRFQWQTAVNATGPFTNLGNPMLTADTTILSDTTLFYRVAVSCGSNTVYSDTVLLTVSPAMRGATYTINKTTANTYIPGKPGGNFVSFAEAKTAMGCGITGGPVVFNVVANTGPYTEQLALDSIAGVTAINTITFNGNGNTITFNSTSSTERSVITLNGADHITFDSLVIDAGTGTYGYGVQLINNADSNTFRKNTILTSVTATNSNYAGIVINSTAAGPAVTGATLCDNNLFEGNTITGGNYGITLVGSTTTATFLDRNKFIRNTIREFYNYGLYVAGTVNTLIEGNLFTRPLRTTSAASVYGIYLTAAASNRLQISKNKFTNFFGGAATGTTAGYAIYHNLVDATTGNEDTVSNNLIYGFNGNGALYGLYNNNSDNVFYYHNTISLDNQGSTSTAATAGFFQTGAATGLRFKNNIVTVTRSGTGTKHAMYRGTTTSEIESNTNDYYVTGTNAYIGYSDATNRTTLADLAGATAQDANSVSYNPLYADSAAGNFKPQLAVIDNLGTPQGIATDILSQGRSATTPDLGAYEYIPAPCASPLLAGTAVIQSNTGACLEKPVKLSVSGHSPLGSVTFQWEASGDGTTNWKAISPVQYFSQYDTLTTVNTYYRAKVACGGTTVYTNVVQLSLNAILPAGTYTIDNSAAATYVPGVPGGNFQSFQTAVGAMLCGVGGKVVVNVLPGTNGTYNEQIFIPYIPGTSASGTVTFQSANGVPASVNLSYAGTATNNYTLKLDSTKNFIFRNLTFTAQNAAFGRVVELSNGASADSLLNNVIVAPVVTAVSNVAAGIYANANGTKGNNLVIKGNKISNGANGIYFAGTSATVLSGLRHVIDGNEVSGSYADGIHIEFANRITVTNNTVALTGVLAANAAGIYTNYADSAFRLKGNTVNINVVTSAVVNGIYVNNTRAVLVKDSAVIASNRVVAGADNTGTVYGLTVTASKGMHVVNNVIAINSAGAIAYGLYNLNNAGDINYYNNSSNMLAVSATGYPGYFTQITTAALNVKNNIFSNKGGGKALFVNNPALYSADYNMLYSSGALLTGVATGTVTEFADLRTWKSTWNWDASSINYEPAFADNALLTPDLNNPNVWAMHGRGLQIKGNTYDFNNNPRVEDRTKGVPDLGAYEFYPVALPSVLLATPAVPAPNSTQIFSYGSDTVMKISWQGTVPASIAVRRFSGVVPAGLPAGADSMFFYTQVEVPGTNDQQYAAKLYYVDSWQGSIPNQNKLGMARTTPSNAWIVGANSRVDIRKKEISQDAIVYLDRFTGLVNPFAQPENEDSSSNRGKDFWVGYQRSNGFIGAGANGGPQTMKIYMGAGDVPANVTITIEGSTGTPWTRNYYVPANSAITSDNIPQSTPDDARLVTEGLYAKKGIHITSDVPVVTYAHIYESTNSGATMLMPTAVWGYEYYTLSSRQNYTSDSYSAFHVVAQHDNTWVEINPSKRTLAGWLPNGGTRPNGSYLVKLNKGDAYQVLGANESGSEGFDLTGSYIKSVGNDAGECYPIGVFAGSTRTAIGCGATAGGSGDLIIQQIFPYQAWGTKYATAPTSMIAGPSATTKMINVYRIMVKDPLTVVKRNNVVIPVTTLINNKYYQFESNTGDYIEANKPVLVAQFMSSEGTCNVVGNSDPEMFYLSPVQQAIKRTQFYRNNRSAITKNFITLIIPTEGLNTLKIDNVNYLAYPAAERYVYDHPNLPGYSIVTKRWDAGEGASVVESEMPFTGVVYGLGSVESYGYNVGTLVKNLNNLSTVTTSFNTGANPTGYTCKGAPFTVTILLPIEPTTLLWQFSKVPKLKPNVDSLQTNPVPVKTVEVDGVTYYAYTVQQSFVIDTVGFINIPVQYTSPLIEKCSGTETGIVIVQILPAPQTDFKVVFPGGGTAACAGATGTFTGDLITANGIALNQWQWTFPGNVTPSGRVQTYTFPDGGSFPVKLKGITADGCVSDTTKQVVINPRPVVTITNDSLPTCAATPVTFTINNPGAGITYNWYDAPTGGNLVTTGTSFTTATTITLPSSYYVEGVSPTSCESAVRKKVTAYAVAGLAAPVVTATSTPISITFTWTAVSGATGYEVSTDGGTTFITPSSGATGLTHVIEGLTPSTEITLIVRAKGIVSCQTSLSDPVKGKTLLETIFIANAFTPNGDGKNDEFKVYGYTIKEMRFMVFNQWGQKIAEVINPAKDANGGYTVWDGRHKGQMQPSGVYMYVSQMVLLNGTVVNKKGAINLIR
jgi:gliding motility-associated-like protein